MPEFPPISKATWLAKVEKDLRGKPLSELQFEVAGIPQTPFHHADDLTERSYSVRSPRTAPCRSGIALEISNPEVDNKIILDLLNKGANALLLYSDVVDLIDNIDLLLKDVYRELIDVYLMQGDDRGSLQSLQGKLFETVTTPLVDATFTDCAAAMLFDCSEAFSLDPALDPIFWVSIDDDYLTNIARLRALRLCYRLVANAYGSGKACHIVADPFTKLTDKYGGMIATTAMATAAIVGGADTIFLPSGETGDPDEKKFLRRIALNTYNVLDHEAYLNRVTDPAAGSYYLESLTDTLTRQVWGKFQKLSA